MTRVGALIMFAAGVVVSFLLSQKIQKDMRKIVICVNAVAITLVALMPLTWDPIMTIYPMILRLVFNGELFPKPRAMPVRPSFFQITRSSPYLLGPSFS